MKKTTLQVAKGLEIPATDYATQANAVLGIREAGKTYTAMKFAEELLECGIPIIVFDPVGMWKNLKIGTGTHKGYPIVVAGGRGSDITLTRENAVDIVRAAMKENISLVIDLYSPELINKSTWITIVQSVVDLLMYENKAYPVRHIFLEEAAEFIPQKLQPQHAKVYASLERVARMGRNAHLGMTIINQRAEEVNKAILEICELCMIHRQVGKNSLLSIQKWLEIRQLDDVKEIMKSLPLLPKGEGWIVGLGDQPRRVQVLKKHTYHPNPKDLASGEQKVLQSLARDVSSFVTKMNEQLQAKLAPEKKETKTPASLNSAKDVNLIQGLRTEIAQLKELVKAKDLEISNWKSLAVQRGNLLDSFQSFIEKGKESLEVKFKQFGIEISKNGTSVQKIGTKFPETVQKLPSSDPKPASNGTLGKCSREILIFLAQHSDRSFSKAQIGVATLYSQTSSSFLNSLSQLNTLGLITRDAGRIQAAPGTNFREYIGDVPRKEYNAETFKGNLQKCEREIYEVLLENPGVTFSKEGLAARTPSGYSPTSSSYLNSLSKLNSIELIRRSAGGITLNPELLEI